MIHAHGNEVTPLNDSILETIRQMVGLSLYDEAFDLDLIIHINTFLSVISNQFGIGKKGFSISDESATWHDFLGDKEHLYAPVKTYLYIKVKSVFDSSASSVMAQTLKEEAKELEWRMIAENDIEELKAAED